MPRMDTSAKQRYFRMDTLSDMPEIHPLITSHRLNILP